jgi:hypothetical protein
LLAEAANAAGRRSVISERTLQARLNDKGNVLAKAFGDAIREVGIPVGKV